jgi:hypothetical protein
MFETRHRLKRVPTTSRNLYRTVALLLVVSVFGLAAPSPASVPAQRLKPNQVRALSAVRVRAPREAPRPLVRAVPVVPLVKVAPTELLAFTNAPTPTQTYVVNLIHSDFPTSAWHDAEIVAWCESKFRPTDIGFDSNGTHDRGVFQLNDGGTEQYLLTMLGHNPADLDLALNPVINVRLAALLYSRDGWSPWSCASAIPA